MHQRRDGSFVEHKDTCAHIHFYLAVNSRDESQQNNQWSFHGSCSNHYTSHASLVTIQCSHLSSVQKPWPKCEV